MTLPAGHWAWGLEDISEVVSSKPNGKERKDKSFPTPKPGEEYSRRDWGVSVRVSAGKMRHIHGIWRPPHRGTDGHVVMVREAGTVIEGYGSRENTLVPSFSISPNTRRREGPKGGVRRSSQHWGRGVSNKLSRNWNFKLDWTLLLKSDSKFWSLPNMQFKNGKGEIRRHWVESIDGRKIK